MLSTESYFLGGELAKHKLRTQPSVIAPAEKNEKNVFFFYIFANGVGERWKAAIFANKHTVSAVFQTFQSLWDLGKITNF